MSTYWDNLLRRLGSYSTKIQRLQPPCPPQRIQTVQAELGEMPGVLVEMLGHFNGAKLYFARAPFITIFGISMIPPLPPLQWAPDRYVDKFTPVWRNASVGRELDWAIAMKNYGGLAILSADAIVREWDTAMKCWSGQNLSFADWIEDVLREGEIILRER